MDLALKGAEQAQSGSQRGMFGGGQDFASLVSQVPGLGGGLASTARDLQRSSAAQEYENGTTRADTNTQFLGPPGSTSGPAGPSIPGM